MSRYTLSGLGFGEIVLGWDQPIEGFFLQCFAVSSDDEEPDLWLPKLDLTQLTWRMYELGVPMPDLLRRVLLAEQHEWQVELLPGDPVLWGNTNCRVLELRHSPAASRALVEHAEGATWTDATQLRPDLQSVGVN